MCSQSTVTIVFTDLVGSTAMAARLGEEAAAAIFRRHFTLLERATRASAGEVVQKLGDGVMVVYHSAAAALSGAVGMQQAIDADNRRGLAEPLALRVGLAIGDVTCEDGDYFGMPVVQAARLCARAEGGQILAAEVVAALAGDRGGHHYSSSGLFELKGLPDPVATVEVNWEPLPPGSTVPLPVALEAADQFPFVGREGESAQLRRAFEQAAMGERRGVVVTGEPGIGKTRLAAELAREMHGLGATVLHGRCDEDMGVPYQPVVEALRHFASHVHPEELPDRLGAHGGELTRLVPELAQRAPELRSPLKSDPETERYRLFHAVMDWLHTCSDEEPVVMVLDDLQWATKDTVLLLRHMLTAPDSLRLLVVGTYRDTEVGVGHPVTELVADLWRGPGTERVALGGLAEAEMGGFLETLGQDANGDEAALARTLHTETAGNPFFVSELVRHLVEGGSTHLDEDTIPRGVRDVVERRVARMSDATARTLRLASVLGEVFEVALLEESAGCDVIDALDEAAAGRLVIEAGFSSYRFAHDLVRATLYDGLSGPRRVQLHRRAGEAIEAEYAPRLEGHVRELAYHFTQVASSGNEVDKAIDYASRAGADALAHLAPDEAVRWYTHALEVLDRLDLATRDEQRCAVLLHLGTAQRLAGRPEFGQTLLDAARLAQHLGDTDRLVAAALTNTRGFTSHMGHLDDERLAVLRAALDAIGTSSPGLRARLLAQWAIETMLTPDYDNQALIAEALTLTETSDDAEARLRALSALLAKAIPHNLEERRACQAELLELASQRDPVQQCGALSACCVQAVQAGEVVDAQRFLDDMGRTAQASGDPAMRWMAETYAAALGAFHGDHFAAEQHANTALRLGIEAAQPDALLVHAALLLSIRRVQGREAELCEPTAQMAAKYPGIPSVRGALAWLLAASNRNNEARAILDDLVADLPSLWVDRVWATTLATCTDAAALIGHAATARSVVPLLAPFADQWIFNGGNSDGPVALVLAVARTALADYEQADADFEYALAMAEHAGSLYWTARAQLDWAVMLHQRNQSDDQHRATPLLRKALHTAAESGYAGIERRGTRLAVA